MVHLRVVMVIHQVLAQFQQAAAVGVAVLATQIKMEKMVDVVGVAAHWQVPHILLELEELELQQKVLVEVMVKLALRQQAGVGEQVELVLLELVQLEVMADQELLLQ
ncbi:MAG: hypothetical protein EBR82_71030 [Caulobacteraceae bacterium]|nr:hypothetical protein [Caulobacteraceae bacterium]